jgi:hypothetical protein
MKSIQLLLSDLVLTGTLGVMAQPLSAQGMPQGVPSTTILEKSNDYCHMKFPAIREATLGGNHPMLKDGDSDDIIDFHGPCDHDVPGKDEIQAQRIQMRHRREVHLGE